MARLFPRWLKRYFRDDQFKENLNFFRNVTLFHGMTNRQLGRLIQAMQKRSYRAGENLFTEGQVGRAVFIIRSGQVELTKKNSNGKRLRLGLMGSGQIFGEMALLENRQRLAGATVVEDAEIYLLYTASIENLIKRFPEIGVKLLKNIGILLSAILRRSNERIARKIKTDQVA